MSIVTIECSDQRAELILLNRDADELARGRGEVTFDATEPGIFRVTVIQPWSESVHSVAIDPNVQQHYSVEAPRNGRLVFTPNKERTWQLEQCHQGVLRGRLWVNAILVVYVLGDDKRIGAHVRLKGLSGFRLPPVSIKRKRGFGWTHSFRVRPGSYELQLRGSERKFGHAVYCESRFATEVFVHADGQLQAIPRFFQFMTKLGGRPTAVFKLQRTEERVAALLNPKEQRQMRKLPANFDRLPPIEAMATGYAVYRDVLKLRSSVEGADGIRVALRGLRKGALCHLDRMRSSADFRILALAAAWEEVALDCDVNGGEIPPLNEVVDLLKLPRRNPSPRTIILVCLGLVLLSGAGLFGLRPELTAESEMAPVLAIPVAGLALGCLIMGVFGLINRAELRLKGVPVFAQGMSVFLRIASLYDELASGRGLVSGVAVRAQSAKLWTTWDASMSSRAAIKRFTRSLDRLEMDLDKFETSQVNRNLTTDETPQRAARTHLAQALRVPASLVSRFADKLEIEKALKVVQISPDRFRDYMSKQSSTQLEKDSTPGGRTPFAPVASFGLGELIVVMTLLVVLAAVLFPVFANAKESSKLASEISNVKLLGTSVIMYAQDYDEELPFGYQSRFQLAQQASFRGIKGPSPMIVHWSHVIEPYVGNKDLYVSPSDPRGGMAPLNYSESVVSSTGQVSLGNGSDLQVQRLSFTANDAVMPGLEGRSRSRVVNLTEIDQVSQTMMLLPMTSHPACVGTIKAVSDGYAYRSYRTTSGFSSVDPNELIELDVVRRLQQDCLQKSENQGTVVTPPVCVLASESEGRSKRAVTMTDASARALELREMFRSDKAYWGESNYSRSRQGGTEVPGSRGRKNRP